VSEESSIGKPEQAEPKDALDLWPVCPRCHEPWLRPTQLPGRYRCVYCLVRFQLMSYCPSCGEHSTIVRMRDTANMNCMRCGQSMLKPV
jgi:hypothetical protein